MLLVTTILKYFLLSHSLKFCNFITKQPESIKLIVLMHILPAEAAEISVF